MKTKKILSASLAAAMLLSYAPTAYAADPVVVIDPLGTVYEMGDDNTLEITDGIIGHGESFYMLLVDEATGDPTQIKSDDLRSLRVYADWEVGESRVSGEDIFYRKAEDVIVNASAVPNLTYKLNLTLNLPDNRIITMDGITKADGSGYTLSEIDALTTAQKDEIIDRELAKLKADHLSAYQEALIGNQYELVNNAYILDGKVYRSLEEAGITHVQNGFSFLDPVPSNGTLYFDSSSDRDLYLREKNWTIATTSTPIYEHNAAFFDSSIYDNALDAAAGLRPGRDLVGVTTAAFYRADPADEGEYIYVPIGNYSLSKILSNNHELADIAYMTDRWDYTAYAIASDTTPLTVSSGEAFTLVNTGAGGVPEAKYHKTSTTNQILTGYMVVHSANNYTYYENTAALLAATVYMPYQSGSYGKLDASNKVIRYFPSQAAAFAELVADNELTAYTSGIFSASGKITDNTFLPASFYASTTDVNGTSPITSTKNVTTQASAWRSAYSKTLTAESDVNEAITNIENALDSADINTLVKGEMINSSTFSTRASTAVLSGSDYYYFVEVETKDYTGADSYDVVGYVSVGKSTSDAEDRGSAEVAITLSAGDYDNGTPQDNDIEIEGESGAVVEFEDNAGEIHIHWNDEAMFIVNVSGQGDLNLGYNTDFDSDFADRHGYANIDFLNFVAQPRFNRNGEFYLYASEDAYIYVLDEDGLPREISGLEYDEDEEAWTFRTNQLTSYVISDEELVLTDADGNIEEPDDATPETQAPVIGKPNPGTGR